MAEIQHLAMCTKNNRRLARFYHYIFGSEEVWNRFQNSPYSFYMSDGYLNLNCLQIRSGSSYNRIVDGKEIMPDVGINHFGFWVKALKKSSDDLRPLILRRDSSPARRTGVMRNGALRMPMGACWRLPKAVGKPEVKKGSPH
jgi:hypothetical protein